MQVYSVTGGYGMTQETRQPAKSLDKDAFLKLFVEQLKQQDPMSPLDSSAFIGQMAQFTMLEQLTNMNEEIARLRLSQELGLASALLGRQVKIQSGGEEVAGQVEKVTLAGGEVKLLVGGSVYGIEQVTEVLQGDGR